MQIKTWLNSINSRVRILPTKKIFYKKYAYKAQYTKYVPNTFFYSKQNRIKYLINQFEKIHNTKVMITFSGYSLLVYALDENSLRDLIGNTLIDFINELKSVNLADSTENLELLKSGHILFGSKPDFNYQLTLRSGFYELFEKQALASYLKELGEEVHVSKGVLNKLENGRFRYFSGANIRLKDQRVGELIRLISPKIVGTVNILTQTK